MAICRVVVTLASTIVRVLTRSLLRLGLVGWIACAGHVSVMAQTPDSLSYLEDLASGELAVDDLYADMDLADMSRNEQKSLPAPMLPLKRSGAWDVSISGKGRLSTRLAWSPHRWIRVSGTILREEAEPTRFDPANQWFGGEHASGYLELGSRRLTVMVGDFRFQSAAALSSVGMRTSEPTRQASVRATVRPPVLRSYSGASQQPAPRGLAVLVVPYVGWKLGGFVSSRREDGQLETGPELDGHPGSIQVAFRKSWRLSTASSLDSRRKILLLAHGAYASFTGRTLGAGASWTAFNVPGISGRHMLEAQARAGRPRTGFLAASTAYALSGEKRGASNGGGIAAWTLEGSLPLSGMTVSAFTRKENPDSALPWGPTVSLHERDHTRHTSILSLHTKHPTGKSIAWGVRYHARTPRETRRPGQRQVATWIGVSADHWGAEIRVRQSENPEHGDWNGRVRLSIRLNSALHRTIRIQSHLVAARAGGLSTRIHWQVGPRTRIIHGRSLVWGRDPDPWAVLVTDRAPGQLGLLRMSQPTTHWSIRLEMELRRAGRFSLSVDERTRRSQPSGQLEAVRSIVFSWRS